MVSSTLGDELPWSNSTRISGDVAGEVGKLKEQDGGDMLVAGSATLARTLREHDLVDEYRLMVFPIVLGSGKRLFEGESDASVLELVSQRRWVRAR